ncbi:MAG: glycosyltransferase family 4 protein [Alphaproteobacteria bacterium]|uniref:Glycosyltransferase family 4 protein n=1 Tax=Candidatus Nitrobium versatile TaxID=2884831 RepID=A0A953LX82_9BACT|nr:glycosyltransferase family 4 protein [Candidatus Nitrobium versatile]
MRVAYLLDVFPLVSETFVVNEILELRRQGAEVSLFALRRPQESVVSERASELKEEAVYWDPQYDIISRKMLNALPVFFRRPVQYVKGLKYAKKFDAAFLYNYKRIALFARFLLQRKVQHIHAHFASTAAELSLCLSLMTGMPFSFTTHGYDVFFSPHRFYRTMGEHAKFVVAVSEFNREYLAERYRVPKEKIRVVRCGIDTDLFRPHRTAAEKDIDVVTVARLHPVKGLPYLVRACRTLKEKRREVRCAVIGEGRERESLQRMIREEGVGENIALLGNRSPEEVVQYLSRSKVFVLPSTSEAMPVSLMEALACTVPVVATRVRGIPELVEEGVNGYLVKPRHSRLLAEKISLLLENDELRERMGRAGRERVVRDFNLKTETGKLRELFEK